MGIEEIKEKRIFAPKNGIITMEQKGKNISLKRFEDGTPSIMRKPTVYTELHFYRKSDGWCS